MLLSACGKHNITYFTSKEEALEDFIQREAINGEMDLILTMNDDELLVMQQDTNHYFVGELLADKKGFAAHRISDNVAMELGGSWELTSSSNHAYTIYFEQEQENQDYFPLSNEAYYISLVEGHQVKKEDPIFTNTITSIKAIQH